MYWFTNMPSGKRYAQGLIAVMVCVFLLTASCFPVGFVLTHAGHIHDNNGPDGGCAVCVHLALAENLIKILSIAVAGAVFVCGLLSAILFLLRLAVFDGEGLTLVQLKIRLNN